MKFSDGFSEAFGAPFYLSSNRTFFVESWQLFPRRKGVFFAVIDAQLQDTDSEYWAFRVFFHQYGLENRLIRNETRAIHFAAREVIWEFIDECVRAENFTNRTCTTDFVVGAPPDLDSSHPFCA